MIQVVFDILRGVAIYLIVGAVFAATVYFIAPPMAGGRVIIAVAGGGAFVLLCAVLVFAAVGR